MCQEQTALYETEREKESLRKKVLALSGSFPACAMSTEHSFQLVPIWKSLQLRCSFLQHAVIFLESHDI